MSSDRPRVLVLFGGRSTEHSISCVSARCVLDAMDRDRWTPVPVGITRDGRWLSVPDAAALPLGSDGLPYVPDDGESAALPPDPALVAAVCDVAFPLLHGAYGEDGTVQGLFELAGLPYVGSGVLASATAMDKIVMKRLLTAAGLPIGPWVEVDRAAWVDDPASVLARIAKLPAPWFVKPSRGGSSLGISRVSDPGGLTTAIEAAAQCDPRVLVEAGLPGREIECGVLTDASGRIDSSVPGEIVVAPGREFYDFEAKYLDPEAVGLQVPAVLAPETAAAIATMSRDAVIALGCEGLARVDFFVGDDIVINEVNTMPGFTPQSMFPRMWLASGLEYADLVDHLLQAAISRPATILR